MAKYPHDWMIFPVQSEYPVFDVVVRHSLKPIQAALSPHLQKIKTETFY
jgi:hypothetical protein